VTGEAGEDLLPGFSLPHIQFRGTDAAGHHSHQHLVRPRLGQRFFKELEIARAA
jgi:hypothetical protein